MSRCSREETHLLEMPLEDSPVTIALLENNPVSKPVPMATVRSTKLAAMAASMNRTDTEPEFDLETSADEDAQESDPNLMRLEDILIAPEIISQENGECNENVDYCENNDDSGSSGNDSAFDQPNKADGSTRQGNRRASHANGVEKSEEEDEGNCDAAGTSNLSLSRVNPSGMPEATSRLGSM